MKQYDNMNGYSIVLRMTYGKTSFLFTGDATEESENQILKRKWAIKSDVLKVGHHGSFSSTSAKFLKKVNPKYAVISCGEENKYSHPHEVVMKRLQNQGVKLYRTDKQGTIVVKSNGKKLTWNKKATRDYSGGESEDDSDDDGKKETRPEPTEPEPTEPDPKPEPDTPDPGNAKYVLNTNTMKIHIPTCSSVGRMAEKNKAYSNLSIAELKQQGYSCCQICLKGK